jgi:carbon dioxide concentrating mechanism protein CcmN
MGSILQVDEGTIEVEAGVSLGAGFLMVGQGKIGMNACIGAATTLFNCSVAQALVVPPGSILGDTTRQITTEVVEPVSNQADTTTKKPKANETKVTTSTSFSASAAVQFQQNSVTTTEAPPSENQSATVENNLTNTTDGVTEPSGENTASENGSQSPNSFGTQIYGQGSIQRLLGTLFPHRQALNNPVGDDRSE